MKLRGGMFLACWIAGSMAVAQDEPVPEPPAELPPNVDLKSPDNSPLSISGEVRTIVGLDPTTKGGGIGLRADVEQLNKAMADVGAKVTPIEIRVECRVTFCLISTRPTLNRGEARCARWRQSTARSKGTVQIQATRSKGRAITCGYLKDARDRLKIGWRRCGLPAASMTTKGFGEANPVAPNEKPNGGDNPEGRARNRRVELIIPTR